MIDAHQNFLPWRFRCPLSLEKVISSSLIISNEKRLVQISASQTSAISPSVPLTISRNAWMDLDDWGKDGKFSVIAWKSHLIRDNKDEKTGDVTPVGQNGAISLVITPSASCIYS